MSRSETTPRQEQGVDLVVGAHGDAQAVIEQTAREVAHQDAGVAQVLVGGGRAFARADAHEHEVGRARQGLEAQGAAALDEGGAPCGLLPGHRHVVEAKQDVVHAVEGESR
jgi:hypothetical protein